MTESEFSKTESKQASSKHPSSKQKLSAKFADLSESSETDRIISNVVTPSGLSQANCKLRIKLPEDTS